MARQYLDQVISRCLRATLNTGSAEVKRSILCGRLLFPAECATTEDILDSVVGRGLIMGQPPIANHQPLTLEKSDFAPSSTPWLLSVSNLDLQLTNPFVCPPTANQCWQLSRPSTSTHDPGNQKHELQNRRVSPAAPLQKQLVQADLNLRYQKSRPCSTPCIFLQAHPLPRLLINC